MNINFDPRFSQTWDFKSQFVHLTLTVFKASILTLLPGVICFMVLSRLLGKDKKKVIFSLPFIIKR